jgi:hypothetical protein
MQSRTKLRVLPGQYISGALKAVWFSSTYFNGLWTMKDCMGTVALQDFKLLAVKDSFSLVAWLSLAWTRILKLSVGDF